MCVWSLLELETHNIAGEAEREVSTQPTSGVTEAPGDFSLPGILPWSFSNASQWGFPTYQKIGVTHLLIEWVTQLHWSYIILVSGDSDRSQALREKSLVKSTR